MTIDFTLTWHWWYLVPLFFIIGYLYVRTKREDDVDDADILPLFVFWLLPAIVSGLLAQHFK